ncbi:MAG: hypothetical protein IK089_01830 [Oxalobacter sp.]|nr:hypothetical protein [Oxalobacter sp.]
MEIVLRLLSLLLLLVVFVAPALAMTEERAIELVEEVDSAAENAVEFNVYPDQESTSWSYPEKGLDGAWVYYVDGENGLMFRGQAWFVSEDKTVNLGRSEDISDCSFLEYSAGDIFTNVTEPDGNIHCHAWTLVEGEVVELDTDGRIYRLGVQSDCLYAEAKPELSGDYNLAFLCMSGGILQEVAAASMTRKQFEAFDGGTELLARVEADGYVVNEILFRYAHPEIDEKLKSYSDGGGVVTLNLTKDSKPAGHTYVFIERETHQLRLDNAFFSTDFAVYDGFGTAKRDVGYDVIKTILK